MILMADRDGRTTSRGRLWSALGVALTAVGCAPPGPQVAVSATHSMRRQLVQGVPHPISYLRAGPTQGPRLILVHGSPGSADSWADYLVSPPDGVEVVAIDRPGFGQSGPARALPALADQAAAVRALLPEKGRPVVLLGHSLGGPVVALLAAQLAAESEVQLAAVVLLAASLDPALEDIHPLQRVGAWAPVRGALPRAIRNANHELMALETELAALAPQLARIQSKVLIVHGTRDDLVPVANVGFMQARLTGARCIETRLLEGRNHFLPWNSEAAVREAIRSALEGVC